MKILDVYIQHGNNALNRPFSYLYAGKDPVDVGFRVLVRFHNQRIMGFVSQVHETSSTPEELAQINGFAFSFIDAVVDKEPLLNPELLQLAEEVAVHYLSPKIAVLQAMLPPSLRPSYSALRAPKIAYEDWLEVLNPDEEGLSDKQIEILRLVVANTTILKKDAGSPSVVKKLVENKHLKIVPKEKERLQIPEYQKEQPHELTIDQQRAYETIRDEPKSTILLQGVTGSGKTEVYLRLSEDYLRQGKNILMLVPEISLTPIMVEYFSRRFQGDVAILHSELTPAEKYDEYRRIAQGKAHVVVGARSAIFAPLTNIGLIILDEEHVESYKQDSVPFYNAREVAIMRAAHFGAKVVLGSATPSLESKARAVKGVYGFASLPKRINEKALPKTTIVDLTKRNLMYKGSPLFSTLLISKIQEKLAKKEQVVLLMNRRGYSSYVSCANCGFIYTCPNCHGNLTYHKADNMLKCHHCDFVMRYPDTCPQCGSNKIMRVGFGTERVVKELLLLFPEASIGRLDSDVGKVRNNIAKTLQEFREKKYDILVGTQMIAKGHDFPDVTLVGVVLADIGLSLPTYRASERTFELITQAVGRAGRADKTGEAIIQTYNPLNYAITLGAKQDYEGFFEREMQVRKLSAYPPYVYLIALTFSGKVEEKVVASAHDVKEDLDRHAFASVQTIGPISPYFNFIEGYFKRSLLIKYKNGEELLPYLHNLLSTLSGKGGVDIVCDVDPMDY